MRGGGSAVAVFDGGGEFVVVGAVGGAEGSVVAVVPEGLAGGPPSQVELGLVAGLADVLAELGSAAVFRCLVDGVAAGVRTVGEGDDADDLTVVDLVARLPDDLVLSAAVVEALTDDEVVDVRARPGPRRDRLGGGRPFVLPARSRRRRSRSRTGSRTRPSPANRSPHRRSPSPCRTAAAC